MLRALSRGDRTPRTLDQAVSATPESGAVLAPFDQGELFLRDPQGDWLRLRWGAGETDRTRRVPPGQYVWTGYRRIQGDWVQSSCALRVPVEVRAGETTPLAFDPVLALTLKLARDGDQVIASGQWVGHGGAGVSLYHRAMRWRLAYRVGALDGVFADG